MERSHSVSRYCIIEQMVRWSDEELLGKRPDDQMARWKRTIDYWRRWYKRSIRFRRLDNCGSETFNRKRSAADITVFSLVGTVAGGSSAVFWVLLSKSKSDVV